MGADLILAWVDAPHDADGGMVREDRAIPVLLERMQRVPEIQLAEIWMSHYGDDPREMTPDDLAEAGYNTDWQADARAFIEDAIRGIWDHREVTWFNIHGHLCFFGGGTSWGDSPEGFDFIVDLALAEICIDAIE